MENIQIKENVLGKLSLIKFTKMGFEKNLTLASLTWYAQRIALKVVTPTSDPRV